MHTAAQGGHVEVLRHLVSSGANINAREGTEGYTVLHYAIKQGDERLADFLLHQCPQLNVTAVTYGGNSALQLGFPVPDEVGDVLRSRGLSSPFSTDEEEEEEDSESDSEQSMYEKNSMFNVPNLVNASA